MDAILELLERTTRQQSELKHATSYDCHLEAQDQEWQYESSLDWKLTVDTETQTEMNLANYLNAEQFYVEDATLAEDRKNTYYGMPFKGARLVERMQESGSRYTEYLLGQPQGQSVTCVCVCFMSRALR